MQSEKNIKSDKGKSDAEKILRSVTFDQGFHFAVDYGNYTGETAISLLNFYEELRTLEPKSVKFHFQRRDFQKWLETTLGDQELASTIDKTPSGLTDKELKTELLKAVKMELEKLQAIINSSKKPTSQESNVNPSGEELKKFTAQDLKQLTGQAGNPAYFGYEGKVYDASESGFWLEGLHLGSHEAGKDLTEALKSAPHGQEVFSKVKQVGILV
jgi:predicted heme/steroid binding protein